MKYLQRTIEPALKKAATQFPAVVLTGPRQAGKSTLLQHIFTEYNYLTFDDPVLRGRAIADPDLFLESLPERYILDEIQYVPQLLPHLKIRVDRERNAKGRFLMTGSQIFNLMAGLTETLAGRIALFEILPFSFQEIGMRQMSMPALFDKLYTGFYPDPCVHGVDSSRYYASYVQTYLERDIRQISSVHDLNMFQRFVELLAARVGGLLNVTEVARDCGISHTTAQKWISLLENSRIIYLLRPYFRNIGKRLVKRPKLYFTDSGLLAYLLRYPTAQTLLAGPSAGAIFENCLVVELLKAKLHSDRLFELYFYRDSNQNEIDVLVDMADTLHLVEIKMRKNISSQDSRVLERLSFEGKAATRWLVSSYEDQVKISPRVSNLPLWEIHSIFRP